MPKGSVLPGQGDVPSFPSPGFKFGVGGAVQVCHCEKGAEGAALECQEPEHGRGLTSRWDSNLEDRGEKREVGLGVCKSLLVWDFAQASNSA